MKKCNICNQLYADNFEQCPNCSAMVSKEIKKIVMPVIIILFVIILFFAANLIKKDKNYLSSLNMGDSYPYTIEKIKLQCISDYPDAVYIVDTNNNKYAVNGNADIYFTKIKKDPKYKGYTTNILKNKMTDTVILQKGLILCRDKK